MGDGAGAGEGEEGAGGCAEDSCRVLHSPRIPCLRTVSYTHLTLPTNREV